MGALLNVHELQQKAMTKGIQKPMDGKSRDRFRKPSARTATINCLFGGWGRSKGKAWYDDLSLNELKPVYKEKKDVEVKGRVEVGRKKNLSDPPVCDWAATTRCHKVGGEGGEVGPPLDGIASRKQRDYIYSLWSSPTRFSPKGLKSSEPARCHRWIFFLIVRKLLASCLIS